MERRVKTGGILGRFVPDGRTEGEKHSHLLPFVMYGIMGELEWECG